MIARQRAKYLVFCAILSVVTPFSLLYNMKYFDLRTSFQVIMQSNFSLDLKYILLWSQTFDPIKSMKEGRDTFIKRRCFFTNCYVSVDRQLLKDIADFDVILFHGRELPRNASLLPQTRSPHQKYIYANMESSARFPVCNKIYNKSYFNWTLTYKLDSDEYFGYIRIRDKAGKVIGPKQEMHWEKVEAMMPINETLKAKLSSKKIAAAWFVSHCRAPSGRDLIAKQLQTELAKFNMQVDIYGRCGTKQCPRRSMEKCLQKLETDYYFYLSFENSFAEDYVTEKLLHALQHYAVPVVYGGANYTRFMPDGIYLTAQKSRVKELAEEMASIINDKQKYYDFFKWHNHYSYHDLNESSETDRFCKMCELINNKEMFAKTSVCKNFINWWSPAYKCH